MKKVRSTGFHEITILFFKSKKYFSLPVLVILFVFSSIPAFSDDDESLIGVTPNIRDYAINTVKPVLDSYAGKDRLSLLLKISEILIDPETGIHKNGIKPGDYMIYDKLNKLKLGFFITCKLSSEQKKTITSWHSKFMRENPADVFFAPSADEIIKTRAAFGCSHYARAFIAVVKALGLVDKPEDLRYAISCKADDYNQALEKQDRVMTINGHQFVLVTIASRWIAINTSKAEWSALPEGFSPDLIEPPRNIPVRFASYPEITFLFRKIGKDHNDDCNDNSLTGLMNIYRSGDVKDSAFKWEKYVEALS